MESRKDKFVGNRFGVARGPKEEKSEMIFGSRPILEALMAGKELEKISCCEAPGIPLLMRL